MGKFIILSLIGCFMIVSASQSPFSLQPAVDALKRREAELEYRREMYGDDSEDFLDDNYWNEENAQMYPARARRAQYNKFLTNYLAHESANQNNDFDADDFNQYQMSHKRSMFRERDRLSQREQEQQSDLADQFLRAIERERELEREERYKQEMRKLWNGYQKDENEIEKDLFREEEYPDGNMDEYLPEEGENDDYRKKKRRMGELEMAPNYWTDKKRSYPMLPWLPATRKKRFPVAKRSPPSPPEEVFRSAGGTDEKVAKDLKDIFGDQSMGDDGDKKKKKRSNEEVAPPSDLEKKSDHKVENVSGHPQAEKQKHLEGSQKNKNCHKHSGEDGHDQDCGDEGSEESEAEEADEESDDEEEDESAEHEDKDKKKREVKNKNNLEVVKENQLPQSHGHIEEKRKRSVEWSKYFGFDRRKKSLKRDYSPTNLYELYKKRKRQNDDEEGGTEYDDENYDDEEDDEDKKRKRGILVLKKKKRSEDEEKLEAMENKLKTIENLIIQDALKYTGAHEGTLDPDEIKQIKTHVTNKLTTAYNLEKMRRAIQKLKQSIQFQKELEESFLDDDNEYSAGNNDDDDKKKKKAAKRVEKAKRVAVKKEKAEFNNNDHEVDEPVKKVPADLPENNLEEEDSKKKKRSEKKRVEPNEEVAFENGPPMSESYMGGHNEFEEECPLLDSIERRCRGIDILSGDLHQDLLQACGIHQLCYLCGTSQSFCDYQYLHETNNICGRHEECRAATKSALTIMRGYPGPQLGPRECSKNPCLLQALRSIGA